MSQAKLLSKQSKKIEQEIVNLYKTVGEMMNLNPRMTEIFAHLKIYQSLTQGQLKQLTGFSLGTISAALQSFLQTDIISRKLIPGTHKNLYNLKTENVNFVYTPSRRLIEDLESLDSYIVEEQAKLQRLQNKYPLETQFLYLRLNGLRNYIETQRRQIDRKQRYSFFEEDVSELLPPSEIIVYPFDTKEIEETIMDHFSYYRDDPIRNRLLSIFYTHRSADQQTLMEHSGFSRSTISRFLRSSLNSAYLQALPRQHRQPKIYYLDNISLSTVSYILNTDQYIYSCIPKFQEILSNLKSEAKVRRDGAETTFLIDRIQTMIDEIERFKKNTRFFRQATKDLSNFLKKSPQE